MIQQILPTSPNWYCSQVCDCDNSHTLVIGARSCLYVYDISKSPLQFESSWQAHLDRLTGVTLCHTSQQGASRWCCTSGEDKKIRIWDLDTRTMLHEHIIHKNNPSTVHWATLNGGPIVSGDDRGAVIAWWPRTETSQILIPEKNPVFSLTCSPHVENHVAVGYKSGAVLLLDVGDRGGILQRLKGHDDEIQCLVWAPVSGFCGLSFSERDDTNAQLLASASRDGTIRVWQKDNDRPVSIFRVQATGKHGKQSRHEDYGKQRLWITLHWLRDQPTHFFSSGHNGDILLWDLADSKPKPKYFSAGQCRKSHQRIVFKICVGGEDNLMYTISMDRQIIVWDIEKQKSLYCVNSLGGFAYCLSTSSLNPEQIAVGVGDSMIRLWNTNSTSSPSDCQVLWQGIKAKVTALSWHPEKEGSLAYGTDDGRVGIYNVLSAKGSHISSTYHKRTAYGVCWGPSLMSQDSKGDVEVPTYVLYSVGDGCILLHKPQHLDKPANKVLPAIKRSVPHSASCTEMQWKPDFTVVAIGYDDGVIEVVQASDNQVICSIHVLRKLINCLSWHPVYTSESTDISLSHSWLAAGSNEPIIHVFDLKNILGSNDGGVVTMTGSFHVLEGHTQRITSLSWSPHVSGLLVSASYDGTAQVWNVHNGELCANFRNHSGRLLDVLWSLSQSDLVYSASDDFTVRAWKPSAQEYSRPPAEKKKDRKKNQRHKVEAKSSSEVAQKSMVDSRDKGGPVETLNTTPPSQDVQELQSLLLVKKAEILQQHEGGDDSDPDTPAGEASDEITKVNYSNNLVGAAGDTGNMIKNSSVGSKKSKKRKERSLLPLCAGHDNRNRAALQEDCVKLAELVIKEEDNLTNEHLGLLLSRRSTYNLLKKEEEHHISQENWEQQLMLAVMKGNAGEHLKTAATAGKLTDWHMATATMVSPALWRELSIDYSHQLEKEGQLHKAATTLLAAHHLHETLQLYCRHNMFREAMCLAQLRLSPHDPVLSDIRLQWANKLSQDGHFELSARCRVSGGDLLDAAHTLTRRADPAALRTAAVLCEIAAQGEEEQAGAKEAAYSFAQQYISHTLQHWTWDKALQLTLPHHNFMVLSLLVLMHRALCHQLKADSVLIDDIPEQQATDLPPYSTLPVFLMSETTRDPLVPWILKGEALVHGVCRLWHQAGIGTTQQELERLTTQMVALRHAVQAATSTKKMLYIVAMDMSLGLLQLLAGKTEDATASWLSALSTCHSSHMIMLAAGICRVLLPQGPVSLDRIQQELVAMRMAAGAEVCTTNPRGVQESVFKPGDISSSDQCCSASDCLKAFYYYSVLAWLTDRQTVEDKSPVDSKPSTDINHTENDKLMDASTANQAAGAASDFVITVDLLQQYSRSLLWDCHAQRCQLHSKMSRVKSIISGLISNSRNIISEPKSADITPEESKVNPLTAGLQSEKEYHNEDIRLRTASGEYLCMDGKFTVLSPRLKPHQRVLLSPAQNKTPTFERQESNMDDYEEMHPESPVCTSVCQPEHNSNTVQETQNKKLSTGRKISVKSNLAEVLESLSAEPTSITENRGSETNPTDDVSKLEMFGEAKSVASPLYQIPSDAAVPSEYRDDSGLDELNIELKMISNKLNQLPNSEVYPFPSPLSSARLLLSIAPKPEEENLMVLLAIAGWSSQKAYLDSDLAYFTEQLKLLNAQTKNDVNNE